MSAFVQVYDVRRIVEETVDSYGDREQAMRAATALGHGFRVVARSVEVEGPEVPFHHRFALPACVSFRDVDWARVEAGVVASREAEGDMEDTRRMRGE